jgi:predicted ATP-grasp superfamily ATP-dependent carboligase
MAICCTVSRERVLLTGDEGTGTLAAVRGLRAAGHEPWLAVSRDGTYAARSRAAAGVLRVPDAKDEPVRHAVAVANEALRLQVAAVLPGTEGSLRALTGSESLFREIPVGTTPADALERATDKATLARFAATAGLESPASHEVVDGTLPEDLEFPVIAKPVASVAPEGDVYRSHDVHRVESGAALRRVVASGGRWLIQPYIAGTLGAIGGVAWEGRLVCASHQVSPRIWPVSRGISSYAVTVEPNRALEDGVARLLELVGWSGVFGVQFIHSKGRSFVIDLNPRIYGSTALAIRAGHNLPAIWTDLLLGRDPKPGPYRVGVRYRVEEDDIRAIIRTRDWRGLIPRRDTVHGVFDRSDPLPSLESLRKLLPF